MATETTNPAVPEEQTGLAGDAQNKTAAVIAADDLPETAPKDDLADGEERTVKSVETDVTPDDKDLKAEETEHSLPAVSESQEVQADNHAGGVPQGGEIPTEVGESMVEEPAEENAAVAVEADLSTEPAEDVNADQAVNTEEQALKDDAGTEPDAAPQTDNAGDTPADVNAGDPEDSVKNPEQASVSQVGQGEQKDERVDFSDEEAQLDIIAAEHPDYDLGDEDDSELAVGEIPAGSEVFDTAGKSKAQLLDMFAVLLAERPVHTIRREVEAVKVAFYKLLRADYEELRRKFVEDGGQPEDFAPPVDSEEQRLKDLFSEYRKRRDEFIAQLDRSKEENLKIKQKIIEDLKELVNSSGTLGNTFNTFRDLQQRWREAGPVPQANVKDLWKTYNHHVENFYSYIKINKELRDLDLKKNYEAKVALCEEAEALVLEPSVLNSFHRLQKLHEQWREIGPVAREYKETVWERFKEASSRINKQHQDYFDTKKEEQKRNLELKTELCRKTQELSEGMWTTRKEWNKASDKLLEIQKVWKTIGFAPRKDNARIYEQFRNLCDRFFEQKRTFYQQIKAEMDHNLQMKQEICQAAEALQESEDWKKTTEELIALQKRWKEIGSVPRRHSDAVWKRFHAACGRFFDRKSSHISSRDTEQDNNLRLKRELLGEIAAADITAGGFELIKGFQRRWSEIGCVPIKKKDALQKEYKAVMDTAFATLRDSGHNVRLDRFKDKVRNMKSSGDKRLRFERDRLYNKVKQMESEIALLENNIGFFSNSKNAESMIRDVEQKIARTHEEMAATIEKINLIDSQE